MNLKPLLTTATLAGASTVTNQITGVGPSDVSKKINPIWCIQDDSGEITYHLAYGDSVDPYAYSGNAGYAGGALRFNGCSYEDTYLGYMGLSGSTTSYESPEGVHISYKNREIDDEGNLTGAIEYTAIESNFNLPAPCSGNRTWEYSGVNFSGNEFGTEPAPNTIVNFSQEDAATASSDLADMKDFTFSGLNTVRMPNHWGFLQPDGAGKGEIYANFYDSYIKPSLQSTTSAGHYTIIDWHTYFRYSEFGKQAAGCDGNGPCPDGTLIIDSAVYIDALTKLNDLISADTNIDMSRILIDISNEPVEVPDDKVFTVQVDVMQALQAAGFNGKFLVSGNFWSGLHSWASSSWTSSDGKTYTNANLLTRDNFVAAGIDPDSIIINAHQYLDSDYSGTHSDCLTDLSTTGSTGFNLQSFVDYLEENQFKAMVTEFGAGSDQSTCESALRQFLDYMQTNAATGDKKHGFVGWQMWGAGHGWGDYDMGVTPDSYKWDIVSSYLPQCPEQNTSEDTPEKVGEVKELSKEQKWNKHYSEYSGKLFRPLGRGVEPAKNAEHLMTPKRA
jgi:endoglucanase